LRLLASLKFATAPSLFARVTAPCNIDAAAAAEAAAAACIVCTLLMH